MANQIQATVYQIDGSPLNNSIQIAFLTSNVYMREFQTDLIPAVNSAIVYYPNTNNQLQEQTFLVSETISALVSSANTSGTSQISTTVLEINQEPQIPGGLTFSFPVQGISIWPVANPIVDGVNSYLEFKNKKYYLLEDEATLVTAANAGNESGSTGVNGLNGTTSIGLGGALGNDTTIDADSYKLFIFDLRELEINTSGTVNTNILNNELGINLKVNNSISGNLCSFFIEENAINTLVGNTFKGLSINFDSELYRLGDNSTSIETNTQDNKIEFNASNITFSNVATSSTGAVTLPLEFLNIVVNGQNRKLQLFV